MLLRFILTILCLVLAWNADTFAAHKAHHHGVLKKSVRHKRRHKPRAKSLADKYNHNVLTYFGGTPIVTSPYLGLRSEFDGSDLIVNLPSVNEDLRLLQHRYILDSHFYSKYNHIPETPLIEVSGQLAAASNYTDPYLGRGKNNIDLTDAELDLVVHAHMWLTGFMAMAYDNSGNSSLVSHRISNSRVYLDKGFLTFGNLHHSPFYMTLGQSYVPFGRYKSHTIAGSVTKYIGRSKQRVVIVGYKQPGRTGLYGNVFYFKGNTLNRGRNNGGAHLGYAFCNQDYKGEFGTSFIFNMADADGFQITGKPGFKGFAFPEVAPAETQNLVHTVPGFHAHMSVSHENVDVLAEFVTALRKFDAADLSYNTYGARPWAVNVEGSVHFSMDGKPAAFSLGYGHTEKALAIQVPNHRIALVFNTSWFRDTIESIEIRHEMNYSKHATASGRGIMVPTGPLGKTQTVITGKVILYW